MNLTPPRKKMACHCGWCGAVRQHDGTWDFIDQTDRTDTPVRFDPVRSNTVTHGICPDCATAFRADAALGHGSRPRHQETFEPRTDSPFLMASF